MALFFSVFAHGQNTETDSLKKLLASTAEGPRRVLVLESLSYAYLSSYPDTALQYAIQGLQLARKIKDYRGEAYCTNALGNVYFGVGDYANALEMYLRSLKMKEQLKNEQRSIAVTYFNIANVYTEQQDYTHALEYLFKTKQVDEKRKDSTGILFDLYSLGSIYLRMGKADSALHYTSMAYQLSQRLHDENIIGAITSTYGDIYVSLKDFDRARKYFQLSIPYAEAIKDHEVLASDYLGLAKIFKQTGLLDSAAYYSRKALIVANEGPFPKAVLESSVLLTDVFKTKKRFDSAFKYQELSMATRDSLFNVEKIKRVQNLKLMEQQRQQAIETATIEYRNKVRFYLVIVASVIFLAIALLLWRSNKQKQKANVLLQQEKLKTEHAYEELKSTQAQLIQREKMASLGELTAGIAHEIQNPMNFVNNFSEVSLELVDELKDAIFNKLPEVEKKHVQHVLDDLSQNLEKIGHHGKRADAIVKGMLQHSRTSTGKKEPTDINALADEYLRLSYHGLRAKDKTFSAHFETCLDKSIVKLNIVPQDIGRVLLNLFNNAFYSVSEKKKQLYGSFEPMVHVKTEKTNGKVRISVKDNGTGIPQKVMDKIFQPFFTTKPTGHGTGLGLSLSYDIVTKGHGGELKVKTSPGEGTEFICVLPASKNERV
ncbi:MAG: tetratricopeptide repeat protein [Chitinophagaceae bacterium]|nr:tetratricopeptide repeat protein [Chitinophagaceae bacterium]